MTLDHTFLVGRNNEDLDVAVLGINPWPIAAVGIGIQQIQPSTLPDLRRVLTDSRSEHETVESAD
jgi:hypothetical protein